ncbi:homoserine dehydrogenase [bacterium]|nr:homoserine dehydrogenase [bacterium]
MEDAIKVGLCGLGTVGSGVFRLLSENAALIRNRIGRNIIITKVATIDRYDNLGLDFSQTRVLDSVDDILQDPEIDIVVELIGGKTIAKRIVLESLQAGKSVVTANKALLAEYLEEIFHAAYKSKGTLGFEASVAGGIPIIRSIKQGFSGDRIDKFSGIVNGTANYILSAMSRDGINFHNALKDAQERGYAEADPTFDIEGIDAAHKVILLMAVSFNTLFEYSQLYIEGITGIDPVDIAIAAESGYVIKLLGRGLRTEKGYEGRVCPALVSKDNMLASVTGAFNAVSVWGNFVGETLSYGAGAGSHPTASAVVSDIIETARLINAGIDNPVPPLNIEAECLTKKDILPIDDTESEYYLRIMLNNTEKSINSIIRILSEADIDIRSMGQKPVSNDLPTQKNLILFTEMANEKRMQLAIQKLNGLSFVTKPVRMIRVEH